MKVAMLGSYPLGNKLSGVGAHIEGLSLHLSQIDNIDLHVITFGNENKQFKEGKLNIHVLKRRFRAALSIPIETLRLRKEIIRINPNIVHAHDTSYPYATAGVLVRNRYPTLLSVHGILAEMAKFSNRPIDLVVNGLLGKPLERLAVSRIPNIIASTPYAKDYLNNMTDSKLYVVPNAIRFESARNVKPLKAIRKPSILFVGWLSRNKGVATLLQAIPIIKRRIPNIRVYIAGAGPQEAEVRKIANKLAVEENTEFLGVIEREGKYSYYISVDICVVPSLVNEGFPTVLLEAMICGKPVVASKVGGIPYIVKDKETGLLFEPGNAEDLADKAITLLQDKELRDRMGEAAEVRAREFTWDKITERTVEIYREVLLNWSQKPAK